MFNNGYYNTFELRSMGFSSVGDNVKIAKDCTILGCQNINIGDNVRIDSYCSISALGDGAYLNIGRNVHIAAYSLLAAGAGLILNDFSGLSHGVRIYTKSDDYSGHSLTNPTVPDDFKRISSGVVEIGRHVILGSGCVVLPGVVIEDGCSVGALSLVTKKLDGWGIYFGIPVKKIKDRNKGLLKLEEIYINQEGKPI